MDNTNGVRRAVEKITRLSTGEYDGLARDGELVVDLDTHQLYIGNSLGNLNLVGGNEGVVGAPNGSFQYNYNGILRGSTTLIMNPVTNKVTINDLSKFAIAGGNPGDVLSTDGNGNLVWINSCCNDCYDAVLTVDSATWSSDDPDTTDKTIEVVTTLNNGSTVKSIVRLVIAGFVINTAGITITDGVFTIPASALPVDLQSDTAKLTLVLTVLDADDVSHGPASVTVIPRLGGGGVDTAAPFSVFGTLELTSTDGADRPFWDGTGALSSLTVSGLVLDSGIIESVTYTLRREDGTAVGTPVVKNNFTPVTFSPIAPGRYYVEALVFGRASSGPAISVSKTYRTDITDNPAVITELGVTYEPLLYRIHNTDDHVFTTGDNYVPKHFESGDVLEFPDTTSDYFIVAVPGNSNNEFHFTLPPLPAAELYPDSDYDQEIDGVFYKMYVFSGGTPVDVTITRKP